MYIEPSTPGTAYATLHITIGTITEYTTCTTYTQQNNCTYIDHTLTPQTTLLLVSFHYPCLSYHVTGHTTFTSVMYPSSLPVHNINMGIVQAYNIKSYLHNTDLVDLSRLLCHLIPHIQEPS